jgi:hypothetical protein
VEGDLSRFRCHLGHAYGAELMSVALDENLAARPGERSAGARGARGAGAKALQNQAKAGGHRLLAENWAAKLKEFDTRNGRYPQFDPPHGPPCRTGGYGERARPSDAS